MGMRVCHQAFIARRSTAPLYESTNLSADIAWEIECLKKAKKTRLLSFVMCRYLVGGLSVQRHRRSLLDRYRVLRKHFGLIPTLWYHGLIILRGGVFALRKGGKYW
jgi:hypothetical protein